MNSKKIHLTGYIDVPADRMEAIKTALIEHIRLTHTEAGCVSFEVTPAPDHPGRFNVAEVFINREAFDLHQSRTATSEWAQLTKGIARSYQIEEID